MTADGKFKVLAVDDEAPIREFIHTVLTNEGYEVLTASDGEEALDIATQDEPDLILLDINMPKLDGMETCQRLRANRVTRNIPIIILTAYNSQDRLEDSIIHGADDFLGKPIDLAELCVRVSALIKVKDIEDEVERMEQYVRTMKSLRQKRS